MHAAVTQRVACLSSTCLEQPRSLRLWKPLLELPVIRSGGSLLRSRLDLIANNDHDSLHRDNLDSR